MQDFAGKDKEGTASAERPVEHLRGQAPPAGMTQKALLTLVYEKVVTLETKVNTLETVVTSLEADVTSLETDNQALRTRVGLRAEDVVSMLRRKARRRGEGRGTPARKNKNSTTPFMDTLGAATEQHDAAQGRSGGAASAVPVPIMSFLDRSTHMSQLKQVKQTTAGALRQGGWIKKDIQEIVNWVHFKVMDPITNWFKGVLLKVWQAIKTNVVDPVRNFINDHVIQVRGLRRCRRDSGDRVGDHVIGWAIM